MNTQNKTIIKIEDLSIQYLNGEGYIRNISLQLERGEVFGLAGESGSGKSSICKAILGLLDKNKAKITGTIDFMENDLTKISDEERCRINGKEVVYIMQNPMTAFDPCMKIKDHFSMTIRSHLLCSKKDAFYYSREVLKKVGLNDCEKILNSYPHMLSGGMLQKVMIAMAILLNPVMMIADEPTTALDALSQIEVLTLLKEIMKEYRPAMLLVSHDIKVLSDITDDLAVMHEGVIIEKGKASEVLRNPREEYTKKLLASNLYNERDKNAVS